ncbi:MAG: hypothetical protein R3266_02865, partial [Gemmatimonadota bacterium]|nr:hypothetical protein [Gemmatimonadota bacterium]
MKFPTHENPSRRALAPWVAGALALAAALPGPLLAQQQAEEAPPATAGEELVSEVPVFMPVTPPPGYQRAVEAGTRSEDGRPGPEYWQQRVDYSIDVSLDPATARITGSEVATLHNNAPVALPFIVVRLYQNVFSEGVERNRSVELT